MENVEIARILEEYADLLEISDDNPFHVRSYRKAAQTVAGLSRPVTRLAEAGEDLTKLPRIGTSMAAHLEVPQSGESARRVPRADPFRDRGAVILFHPLRAEQ